MAKINSLLTIAVILTITSLQAAAQSSESLIKDWIRLGGEAKTYYAECQVETRACASRKAELEAKLAVIGKNFPLRVNVTCKISALNIYRMQYGDDAKFIYCLSNFGPLEIVNASKHCSGPNVAEGRRCFNDRLFVGDVIEVTGWISPDMGQNFCFENAGPAATCWRIGPGNHGDVGPTLISVKK
jgi:hypothetical protein